MSNNILNELEGLIKQASARKAQELQKAAQDGGISTKLDNAEDGTSDASTGEHAADQMQAQRETYPENAADVGAKDNPTGESVDQSSDEATAASTSGQEGAQGAELEPQKEADNGSTLGDTPKPDGWNSGSFKEAAADLRKTAGDLEKAAEELLSPLDRFLVKSARASQNEQLKKQAMAMPDDELANAAADSLMGQIESGEIGDEEAGAILEEALASGAITEEDLAAAAQDMGGAEAGMGGEPAPGPTEISDEQLLEAKLAAADVGPDDPQYMQKLASFYPAEINAGYAFAMKLAQELADADNDGETDSFEENTKDMKDDGKLNNSAGSKKKKEAEVEEVEEAEEAEEAEEKAPEGETDGNGDDTPTEGTPEGEGEGEGGEEREEEVAEEGAEVVPPMPEAVPPMEEEGMGMIAPTSPEEEAALAAVQQELGMDPASLEQLMAAPVPPEAKMALAKTASAMKAGGLDYQTRVRTTILNKVAALRR